MEWIRYVGGVSYSENLILLELTRYSLEYGVHVDEVKNVHCEGSFLFFFNSALLIVKIDSSSGIGSELYSEVRKLSRSIVVFEFVINSRLNWFWVRLRWIVVFKTKLKIGSSFYTGSELKIESRSWIGSELEIESSILIDS